jgi:Fe-S-cluster containining protein
MNPRDPSVPACLSCGVCCFSDLDRYVRVRGIDYERLGDAAEGWVVFWGNEAYMRMENGHCAALELDDQRKSFVCRVYDHRPAVCRELERASPQCLGERQIKAERPALALENLRKTSRNA